MEYYSVIKKNEILLFVAKVGLGGHYANVWITTNCGTFLQEMGIPDHLTWLLRNLYAGQEGTVRTGHGTTDWFQIGKGLCQGCILSPCLFNL